MHYYNEGDQAAYTAKQTNLLIAVLLLLFKLILLLGVNIPFIVGGYFTAEKIGVGKTDYHYFLAATAGIAFLYWVLFHYLVRCVHSNGMALLIISIAYCIMTTYIIQILLSVWHINTIVCWGSGIVISLFGLRFYKMI